MAKQTQGERITVELAQACTVNRPVYPATDGRWDYAAADGLVLGVLVETLSSAAPYMGVVQLSGVAQVESDGSGVIDEGDPIAAGATNQCKKRAKADGATTRYWLGYAISPAAATQALLVDVLIDPHAASNT